MATEEKKVKFSATDDGMSSFMKKMRDEAKSLYETFSNEAKKQTQSSKEQFKIIQEQLKAYREALKVQKEITQEKLKQAQKVLDTEPAFTNEGASRRAEAKREQAKAERDLKDIAERDKQIRGAGDYARNNKPKEEKPESKSSVLNDILRAGLFRDIMSLMRQVPNQENGLGLVSPIASIAGGAAGAASGGLIDLANISILGNKLGDVHASTVLSNLGKEMGGFMGDAITRSFKIRDQYDQSYNKFRAYGGTGSTQNMAAMGYDDIAVANTMAQSSVASGTARGADRRTLATLSLSRGFGIDEGTSMGAFAMQRSGAGNGVTNIQRALGVAVSEGLDRAKLSDAIKTQTQILQHFAESSNQVSSIDANRTMFEFNRMGGMFSLGDPRAMGNIMSVSNGLTSPGSAFGQSQNYAVLRDLFPSADAFDLKRKEEQGLQTPGFLKGVIEQIQSTGASETVQKFMLKNRFSDLSYEGVDTLFKNKSQIGSMSESELSKMLGLKQAQKEAEELTSKYTKMNAEVTNAFRDSFADGIKTLKDQFVSEFGQAITEVSSMLSGVLTDPGQAPVYVPAGSKTPVANNRYRVTRKDGSATDFIKPPALNGSYH